MTEAKETKEKKVKPARRHRWKRLFFLLTLLLAALFLLINGPVTRGVARWAVREGLKKAEIDGSFHLDGTLIGGFQLTKVDLYSEKAGIRGLSASLLEIDYSLRSLMNKEIELVKARDLYCWIDVSAFESSDEVKEPSESTPEEIVEMVRPYVLPIELDIQNTTIIIDKDEKTLWRAEGMSLTHQQGASEILLYISQFTDIEEKVLVQQSAKLVWQEKSIEFGGFPVTHDVIFSHLEWDFEDAESIDFIADIQLGTSHLNAKMLAYTSLEVKLNEGPLLLTLANEWLPEEHHIQGQVDQLALKIADLKEVRAPSDAEFSLAVSGLKYQKYALDEIRISTEASDSALNLNYFVKDRSTVIDGTLGLKLNDTEKQEWQHFASDVDVALQLKIDQYQDYLDELEIEDPIGGWPKLGLHVSGTTALVAGALQDAHADLGVTDFTWAGLDYQAIDISANWLASEQVAKAAVTLKKDGREDIELAGSYGIESQNYSGQLALQSFVLDDLQPLLEVFEVDYPLAGQLDLSWQGEGNVADVLKSAGSLQLTGSEIFVADEQPTIQAKLDASYGGVKVVKLKELEVVRDKLALTSRGAWADGKLVLETLQLTDDGDTIFAAEMEIPASEEIRDLQGFLEQEDELKLHIQADKLPLAKIYELLPMLPNEPLDGLLDIDITANGQLSDPQIDSKIKLSQVSVDGYDFFDGASLELDLLTADKQVDLKGIWTITNQKPFLVNAKMPFELMKWVDNPDSLLEEEFHVDLDSRDINLNRYAELFPKITEVAGSLTIELEGFGKIKEPKIRGDILLDVDRFAMKKRAVPEFKDIDIRIRFDEDQVEIKPSKMRAAGGAFEFSGLIGIADYKNPEFDITLKADKALVWRDDSVIVRSDGLIQVKGPLSGAEISGEVAIVESLFYKDIEIIPVGIPVSQPESAELPSFTTVDTSEGFGLPEPFDKWTVNMLVRTKDDFLVRGNVAEGNIAANIKVTGSLNDPLPDGFVVLKEGKANLPFSRLEVNESRVTFTHKTKFDPELEIVGRSKVGSYTVEMRVFGRASAPKTLMTSNPPLPESEVLLLLLTGTTSSELEDPAVAKAKAYQFLLDSVRRQASGGKPNFLTRVLNLSEKIDINIGGVDPFTGRKFNSATVDLEDFSLPRPRLFGRSSLADNPWFASFSIDDKNNTRGLILYVIRFK